MHSLVIPSGPEAPSVGLRALDGWLDSVPSEVGERVRLAAGEALGNAVDHGDGTPIRLTWTARDGGGRLCVHDGGRFDPTRLGRPSLPDDPMATGGRGLYILSAVADGLSRSADNGLCLDFVTRDAG